MEENEEAAVIYMMCRGQVISVEKHVIDISIPAIKAAMDIYSIKDQKKCLNKVMKLWHFFRKEKENENR